jgi:excisionase family DNA binding protein
MNTPPSRHLTDISTFPAQTLPAFLDADQCAALLRCSKERVEELADRGVLPATKFGRGWIFVAEQLVARIASICEAERAARDAKTAEAIERPKSRRAPLFVPPGAPPRGRGRPRLPTP